MLGAGVMGAGKSKYFGFSNTRKVENLFPMKTESTWEQSYTLNSMKSRIWSMAKPAFVFDGRNILDADALRKIGFEVTSIGKGKAE